MAFAALKPAGDLPPGPRGWSRLSSTWDFVHDWMGFFERCARTYGDIVLFRFLNTPICLVFDPDGIEYVLVRNPANFTKSSDYRALDPLLGEGLLTSEAGLWQAQRKLIQPSFRHEFSPPAARLSGTQRVGLYLEWARNSNR